MPTDEDYEKTVKTMTHGDLLALWSEIEQGNTPLWDSGKAFEYLLLRAFEIEGADVQYPFRIEMQDEIVEQIDGAVHVDGISAILESKDFKKDRVNIEPIAKLRSQLLRRPSTSIGMIFSRTGFTLPALTLSQHLWPQTILVWDGPQVEFALTHSKFRKGLVKKYRVAVELGRNDFDIRTPGAV